MSDERGLGDLIKDNYSRLDYLRIFEPHCRGIKNPDAENVSCLCPFHNDHNASFSFNPNPEKFGVWNCHSCIEKKGEDGKGNIIDFVALAYFGGNRKQATLWLAKEKGLVRDNVEIKPTHKPKKSTLSDKELDEKFKANDYLKAWEFPGKLLVPKKWIESAKQNLWRDKKALKFLTDMGWTETVIDRLQIGIFDGWYWLPYTGLNGEYISVKEVKWVEGEKTQYRGLVRSVASLQSWFTEEQKKFVLQYPDKNRIRFHRNYMYLINNRHAKTIYLCEGEKDAVLLESLGLTPMTNANGAKNWDEEFDPLFKGKNVVMLMDNDTTGRNGAEDRRKGILPVCKTMKDILLEFPPDSPRKKNGEPALNDVTDYYKMFGKDALIALIDSAEQIHKIINNERINFCTLNEASKPRNLNDKCKIDGVRIDAIGDSPGLVPKEIDIKCYASSEQREDKCKYSCAISNPKINFNYYRKLEKTEPILTDMHGRKTSELRKIIAEYLGIKTQCPAYDFDFKSRYNTVYTRLLEAPTHSNRDKPFSNSSRIGIAILENEDAYLKEGSIMDLEVIPTISRDDQSSILQIYSAKNSRSAMDAYEMTPEEHEKLLRFQVQKGQTIESTLKQRYTEFGKLSHLYGVEDMFFAMDLALHSCIEYNAFGQDSRGWVEVAIFGDSGLGKSHMAHFLIEHYNSAEVINMEAATLAGLQGSVEKFQGSHVVRWGALAHADGGALFLDEVTGMPPEWIGQMSCVRTDGIVRITKAASATARARLRKVWMSNTRSQGLVTSVAHPVTHLIKIYYKSEDVRRFDFAYCISSRDVDPQLVNRKHEKIIPKFDQESCSSLIRFLYSLKKEDIIVTPEAEETIIDISIRMAQKYSEEIPLVNGTDYRNKLCRMSISLASILYNVNDEHKIVVTPEHVKFVNDYVDRIYSSRSMGYLSYSRSQKKRMNLVNTREVCDLLGLQDRKQLELIKGYEFISKASMEQILDHATTMRRKKSASYGLNEPEDYISTDSKMHKLKLYGAMADSPYGLKLNAALMEVFNDLNDHYETGGRYEDFIKTLPENSVGSDGADIGNCEDIQPD